MRKKKIGIGIVIVFILSVGILYCIPFFKPLEINNVLNGYEYTVYSDYVELTKYNGKKEHIEIPQYLFGRPVKIIGWGCFRKNKHIKEVVISDSVEIIDTHSFVDCINLTSVKLGQNVKIVETFAFCECDSLQEVKLNEGLKRIEPSAFAGDENLKMIAIPKSVESIGNRAFANSGLETVEFSGKVEILGDEVFEGTPWMKNLGEFAIINGGDLIGYNGTDSVIVIPKGVKCIIGVFYYYEKAAEIYLPDTVEEIRPGSFAHTPLRLYIPSSVTKMDADTYIFDTETTTIITTKGSYAEQYAIEHGVRYEIVDEIIYPESE